MKNYSISCFVRKNNEFLRNMLVKIGVRNNSFDDNSGEWIASSYGIFISVSPGFEELHPEYIDCGSDSDLFLGLSSLTSDNKEVDINSLKENLSGRKSLCWKCKYSCDITNSLKNKGYCGCMFMLTKELVTFNEEEKSHKILNGNIDALELNSGWIYNKRRPYGLGIDVMSGMMTNDSLITKECTKCNYFESYE